MSHRVFLFTYHTPERISRPKSAPAGKDYSRSLHQVRDGNVFLELSFIFNRPDYEMEEIILNLPGFDQNVKLNAEVTPHNDDLVIMGTRPPLSEESGSGRERTVQCSGTDLEAAILTHIKAVFFKHCSRKKIHLHEGLKHVLPRKWNDRGDLEFRPKGGAEYSEAWTRLHDLEQEVINAGFLLYSPQITANGPSLLSVFGIGGVEGWVWARMIRRKPELRDYLLEHVIGSPDHHFLMCEWSESRLAIRQGKSLTSRPMTLSDTDNITPETIIKASCINPVTGAWTLDS